MVTGTASAVVDPAELARYQAALTPWVEGDIEHVVRIRADLVTGYRLVRAGTGC
ncbi:hypothetical protein [Streptomyces sp. NBC_00882]|uniref:hypothetical protein n=1 Tax=Streptomyces sp. NBC_00882 TaxID=2975856 RepID=UPI00386C13A6